MAQWFVLRNEVVTGPFSTDQVKNLAASGQVEDKDLIWGRLQTDWKSIGWWMIELPNLVAKNKEVRDPRQWHYAVNGTAFGPYSREDLIVALKELNTAGEVLLWTKGMKAWAPIFEFNDILDAIGINRRQFPRAEIDGTVTIKIGTQTLTGSLQTISEGGFGVTRIDGVSIGQTVSAEISSDQFHETFHVKAEVRYLTDTGYVGFRFQNLASEARTAIIQYVKGFGRTMVRAA